MLTLIYLLSDCSCSYVCLMRGLVCCCVSWLLGLVALFAGFEFCFACLFVGILVFDVLSALD